jgi:hypothetical protein
MNANKITLEEQTYRFIEFLKSEEFSTQPNLRKFHIELVNFYLAALNHGLHFKKEQRKFNINSLIAKDIESGIFEKKKEITFSKNRIGREALDSLDQISFIYYSRHPTIEDDIEDDGYRYLKGDMSDIVTDFNNIFMIREIYPEHIKKLPSLSDELYQSFLNHWGTSHCIALIHAIHMKLIEDDNFHKEI